MQIMKQDSLGDKNLLVFVSNSFITKVYRARIKPYLRKRKKIICGFYPDCSEYGLLALKKYGFLVGWFKTIKRISRCNTHKHKNSCIDYP